MKERKFLEAQKFYNTTAWHQCRSAFIQQRIAEDGGLCQMCGRELGYIVHHKTELTPDNINDPDISMGFNNLEYVCLSCHSSYHFSSDKELGYMFIDGQPVPLSEK